MAKEIPYEALNTLHVSASFLIYSRHRRTHAADQQNPRTQPGNAHYTKGVIQTKPVLPAIQAAFGQATQLSASGSVEITFMFEYHSTKRMNSVPTGATAIRRRPGCNVVILCDWKEDTAENLKTARDGASCLADIISTSQTGLAEAHKVSYGNYGMSVSYVKVSNKIERC